MRSEDSGFADERERERETSRRVLTCQRVAWFSDVDTWMATTRDGWDPPPLLLSLLFAFSWKWSGYGRFFSQIFIFTLLGLEISAVLPVNSNRCPIQAGRNNFFINFCIWILAPPNTFFFFLVFLSSTACNLFNIKFS